MTMEKMFLFLVLALVLGTRKSASSASRDETDFSTSRGVSSDSRSHTDVLMVTTTVRMLDGVHGHTTNLRPGVPLSLVLEVGSAGLQQRLVDSSSTGDDADHRAVAGRNRLLRSRRQFYFRLVVIRVVGDDGGVVAGSSGQFAAISQLLLQLANDGSLGHGADGHHVADGQRRLLAAVDELARVHALHGDESLLTLLEFVRISEFDDGQGRSSTRVVDDVLHDAFDVPVTLGIVGGPQSSGAFAMFIVGRKDRPRSLTLRTNDATHLSQKY